MDMKSAAITAVRVASTDSALSIRHQRGRCRVPELKPQIAQLRGVKLAVVEELRRNG
jgi:hypothetical protein